MRALGVTAALLVAAVIAESATLRILPQRLIQPDNLIETAITCYPAPEPGELARFSLTLAYDFTLITPTSILTAENAESFWRLTWLTEPSAALPGHYNLTILGRRPSGYISGSGPVDSTLVRILFRPLQPSTPGLSAPVSFFWTGCRDNLLLEAASPVFLVATQAKDPDGADITSASEPPPTATGLCDACLGELAVADTTLERRLVFESTRIPLDLATAIDDPQPSALPSTLTLEPNYPNPFNAGTTIRFTCPPASPWTLDICDILGRTIHSYSGRAPNGHAAISWDGRDRTGAPVASGCYLYRLTAAGETATRKMLLLK